MAIIAINSPWTAINAYAKFLFISPRILYQLFEISLMSYNVYFATHKVSGTTDNINYIKTPSCPSFKGSLTFYSSSDPTPKGKSTAPSMRTVSSLSQDIYPPYTKHPINREELHDQLPILNPAAP